MNSAVNSWNQRAFGTSANGRSGAVNDSQRRMFGASNSGRGGAVNQYLQTGQSLMNGGSGGTAMAGPAITANWQPVTPAQGPTPALNPFAGQQRGPYSDEENPYGPDSKQQRRPIQGYSQSQGAQRTRTGPLSPRTSYTPTSMLPRSQRYSR